MLLGTCLAILRDVTRYQAHGRWIHVVLHATWLMLSRSTYCPILPGSSWAGSCSVLCCQAYVGQDHVMCHAARLMSGSSRWCLTPPGSSSAGSCDVPCCQAHVGQDHVMSHAVRLMLGSSSWCSTLSGSCWGAPRGVRRGETYVKTLVGT